jgi:hypothetical protein
MFNIPFHIRIYVVFFSTLSLSAVLLVTENFSTSLVLGFAVGAFLYQLFDYLLSKLLRKGTVWKLKK